VAQVETDDALREPLAQLPHRADQEEWVVRRIVRGEPVAGRDHGPEALGLRRRLGELHEEHGREGEGRRIPPRRLGETPEASEHSSLATTATYVSHIAPAKAVAEAIAKTTHLAVQP
jgi:hypothetical protein